MMGSYSSNNAIVDQMHGMEITGNVIPSAWYKTITYENGKPNINAIMVLSDIVYWYRPSEQRDEATGRFVGIRKKFKGDLLQRSYQQLADQFGISKRQASSAVKALEDLGVVRRVFKNMNIGGQTVNNVLFIELMPKRLRELTIMSKGEVPISHSNVTALTTESDRVSHFAGIDPPLRCEINTESTKEITDKEHPIASIGMETERFKEQIGYDAIVSDLPLKQGQLDEIVAVAVEVLTSCKATTRVNKEERPTEHVKERLRALTIEHIKYVMESIGNSRSEMKNMRAVLITSLYNAPATIDNYYTAKVNHDLARERGG